MKQDKTEREKAEDPVKRDVACGLRVGWGRKTCMRPHNEVRTSMDTGTIMKLHDRRKGLAATADVTAHERAANRERNSKER